MMLEVFGVHHLTFYVSELEQWQQWFTQRLDFEILEATPEQVLLQSGGVVFLLKYNADYLKQHPPGIGEIVLAVDSIASLLNSSLAIVEQTVHSVTVQPLGAVKLIFTEKSIRSATAGGFVGIDHLVLNVEVGAMLKVAHWFEEHLGWTIQQRFVIAGLDSSLQSCVVRNPSGTVQLALNEPASANSQIQEFLDRNRGWGIQHIALTSTNLLQDVQRFQHQGVQFLQPVTDYYQSFQPEIIQALAPLGVLLDVHPHEPTQQLLQIFTHPIFEEPTFFLEFIQRLGGRQGFGEGNFQALYRAVEQQQRLRPYTGEAKTTELVLP